MNALTIYLFKHNMFRDYSIFLHVLKAGGLLNVYFLFKTTQSWAEALPTEVIIPARILFIVSAWRCIFPNRYVGNTVLHKTPLSSALVTRTLATFAEISWIGQFALLLYSLNVDSTPWITMIAFYMFIQVIGSQFLVWKALLTGKRMLYFFEEAGWFGIFFANTIASAYLQITNDVSEKERSLLSLNIVFGIFYLPFQVLHLRSLRRSALLRDSSHSSVEQNNIVLEQISLIDRLKKLVFETHRSTNAEAWGGIIGVCWMTAYWALLIPPWMYFIVHTLSFSDTH